MEWNEFPETKGDVDYSLLQRSFNIRYENQIKNEQSRQERLLKSYRARQAASMMRDEENRKYKIQMQAEASSSLKDRFTSQNMDKDGDSCGFESFYGTFNTTPFSSSCDSGVTNGLEMRKWILYSVRWQILDIISSLWSNLKSQKRNDRVNDFLTKEMSLPLSTIPWPPSEEGLLSWMRYGPSPLNASIIPTREGERSWEENHARDNKQGGNSLNWKSSCCILGYCCSLSEVTSVNDVISHLMLRDYVPSRGVENTMDLGSSCRNGDDETHDVILHDMSILRAVLIASFHLPSSVPNRIISNDNTFISKTTGNVQESGTVNALNACVFCGEERASKQGKSKDKLNPLISKNAQSSDCSIANSWCHPASLPLLISYETNRSLIRYSNRADKERGRVRSYVKTTNDRQGGFGTPENASNLKHKELRETLRIWHPDKFGSRFGSTLFRLDEVKKEEREQVMEKVKKVCQVVNNQKSV